MRRLAPYALPLVLVVLGLAISQMGLRPSMADLFILSVYYLLLVGSWNLLAGFAGQYSFAHAGLAGVGAYGTAALFHGLGLPSWTGLVVMPAVVAVLGLGLGLVALRVRGVQFPLITFAFAGAFGVFLAAAAGLTGGSMGLAVPKIFPGFDRTPYLAIAGVAAAAFFILQHAILSSRLGLLMTAVRDGEDVAYGMGVDVFTVKLVAFALTAAVAGFAGAFYASYVGMLAPGIVAMNEMGLIVAMAVVGGLGHRYGALVGVVVIRVLEYVVRGFAAEYTLFVITGVTLVVVLVFREGLATSVAGLWHSRSRRSRWSELDAEPAKTAPAASTESVT